MAWEGGKLLEIRDRLACQWCDDLFSLSAEHFFLLYYTVLYSILLLILYQVTAGRPGSSEVPRNPLTRWKVSSIPANRIFLTKKLKNKNKNAQRVEND